MDLSSPSPFVPKPIRGSGSINFLQDGKRFLNEVLADTSPAKILTATCLASVGIGTAAYLCGLYRGNADAVRPKKTRSNLTKHKPKRATSVRQASDMFVQEELDYALEDLRPVSGLSQAIFPKYEKSQSHSTSNIGTKNTTGKVIGIQEGNDRLVLNQCPRGRITPCIAPFPLKLETFLRVHKIKYELEEDSEQPRFHDSPWIRFNTEDITESQNVLQFLIATFDLKSEWNLTPEQDALATAYNHLLENHLYWGIALWRWVYDGAKSLKEIQLLPKHVRKLIPEVCESVEQAAWFHGIGKLSPEEVKSAVMKDLRSLSEFLGSKDFFLNTSAPTELDCTAFGMLAQFLWNMKGPWHDAIENEFVNLANFCWRIRSLYWKDWKSCLNNTRFYDDEEYPTAQTTM